MMLDTSWLQILAFFGLWTICWLPIAYLISKLIHWELSQPLTPQQKIVLLLSLYTLVPIVLGWKITTKNLSLAELGLGTDCNILTSIFLGLVISLSSLIIIFICESALNLVVWHRENFKNLLPLLLPIFGLSILISLIEESVFRGYIFSTLLVDNYLWLAAISSSIIFALLHLIWERKNTAPQIPGLCLMGMVLLGARFINQDHIYLAIGLHAGWIWGLTCIDSAELLVYRHQNHWFTGVNQQPLAGLAGITCLLITSFSLQLI